MVVSFWLGDLEKTMVKNSSDAIVLGGGPAGAAAGIALAARGLSTIIVEKQETVQSKICGEFYSPDCVSYLTELAVQEGFFKQNPMPINNISVSFKGTPVHARFDKPAYGLSRKRFDSTLLEIAEQRGVDVLRGYEVIPQVFINGHAKVFVTNRKTGERREYIPRYLIGATGAKSGSESLFVETKKNNTRTLFTFAFKFHAECPDIENAIELYFTPHGYIGIGSIENGMVNVCGLADTNLIKSHNGNIKAMLQELSKHNSVFCERFNSMRNHSAYVTCSNLSFGRRRQKHNEVLCIGDTAGSIHPFCGDGNAMALKSGLLSAEIIERAIKNNWNRERTVHYFRYRWRREFGARIRISSIIYRILTNDITRPAASMLSTIYPGIINTIFKITRDSQV